MNKDGDEKPKRKPRRYVDDETMVRALNDHQTIAAAARAIDVVPKTIFDRKRNGRILWDEKRNAYVLPPHRKPDTPEYLREQERLRANRDWCQLAPPTTSMSTTEFANPPLPHNPWKPRRPPLS